MDKKKFLGRVAAFVTTTALMVTVARADDQVGPPGVDVAGTPNASGGLSYRAKELIGANVNLDGGTSAGTIEDIVIDDNGNVEFLIVSTAERQLVAIPWAASRYDARQRVVFVTLAPERFRQLPTFVAGRYPIFTAPAYRTQVYGFFGLQPGQRRGAKVDVRSNRIDYHGRTTDGRDRRPEASDRRDDKGNRLPDTKNVPTNNRNDRTDRRNDTPDNDSRPAKPPVVNPPAKNPPTINPPAKNPEIENPATTTPPAATPAAPRAANPPKALPAVPQSPAPKKPAPQNP